MSACLPSRRNNNSLDTMRAFQTRFWRLLVVTIAVAGYQKNGGGVVASSSTSTDRQLSLIRRDKTSANHKKQRTTASYDYIIVGGGLAGCVLAERLSQNAAKKVLLMEAGSADYKKWSIRIPATSLGPFRSSNLDWNYESSGEQACHGRNIGLSQGKVLGGSSCTFACLYHRGSAMDYDQWNVPGWSSADILPFFKAIENVQDLTALDLSSEFHGQDGDWDLDHVRYQNPLSKRFLQVANAAGIGRNNDFNNWAHPQDGAGRFHVSQRNGERCSGALAFLEKAKTRPNLTIQSRAMARKITFDSVSKTATGVVYNHVGKDDDDTYQPSCAQLKDGGEVILTAGAIGTPQILMCSGVGPARHLRAMGIPVVHDNNNVGENLQDHPAVLVSFETPEKGVSVNSKMRKFGLPNPIPFLQWLIRKKGILTSVGCDHGAFVRVTPGVFQPDLQLRFLAAKTLGPDGMTTNPQRRSMTSLDDGYSFQSVAIRAKSKGRVRLASSNSHAKPIIDLGYLSNPDDLATLREGIKLARVLGRRPEWKEFLGREIYPGPEIQTDDQIDNYIRNNVHSTTALCGTCKMGLGSDAVVGPDLKLLGVNAVRVADSSVFPAIPGGQVATPTVMIAERAADFIQNPAMQQEGKESTATIDTEPSPAITTTTTILSQISSKTAVRGGFLKAARMADYRSKGGQVSLQTQLQSSTSTEEEDEADLEEASPPQKSSLWSEMLSRFQGDFDNYDQVVQDRKEGKLPREGGGHENIHCTLLPVEENTRLAAFYFDGQPQAIYRFRYYVLEPVGGTESSKESATSVDTLLFTLHPELEKQLRIASMTPEQWPAIFRDFTDDAQPKISKLENCEVRWSYDIDPVQHSYVPEKYASQSGIHAVMVHGEALVESQMMPGTKILIRDQLSLFPEELWIHDRGLDPTTMKFIYGNQDGVPYRLKRVSNFEAPPSAGETPTSVTRSLTNKDLEWTLGPSFRSEEVYDAKIQGMDGFSRNANVRIPPQKTS